MQAPAAAAESPTTEKADAVSLKGSSKSLEENNEKSSKQTTEAKQSDVAASAGVKRMEAIAKAGAVRPSMMWTIRICVLVTAWAYSLQSSSTYSYEPLATSSFGQHSSGLAALSIASSIISAVSKPFIAKISDITSRPYTFSLVVLLYMLGFIIVASSSSLAAYIVGDVFISIGYSGLDLLSDIIVADLISLQWRGLAGAMLSAPYIINTWFAGLIVEALSTGEEWRWGYGMFAIIVPVVMIPCICVLIYLERKAIKGTVGITSSRAARRHLKQVEEAQAGERAAADIEPLLDEPWAAKFKRGLHEIDALGLLLLGFGWSLLLLPFSLKSYADNGYANRSLVAMFVVGGICLIAWLVWEIRFAPFPTAPKRLLTNKTFILAVGIDFIYMFAGSFRSLYFSSYTWIVQDWSAQNWTYANNSLTLSLCVFGIVAGALQRLTHRYKTIQIVGLCVKIIGHGLLVDAHPRQTWRLITAPILVGLGGSWSVVGSRVASQAAVPHQDVALVISLLSLWSKIGSSIGSAITVSVWSKHMPVNLRDELPASVSDAQVAKFFGNIRAIRAYDYNSEVRQGAIRAYEQTVWHLWPVALGLCFVPLIFACFQTNFYLGKQQNAYDNKGTDGEEMEVDEVAQADERRRAALPKWQFWAR